MQLFIKPLKLDKVNENAGGGAPATATPPASSEPAQQQPPAATPPAAQAQGDELDDFGYAKVSEGNPPTPAAPKAGDPAPKAAAPPTEEITDPGTGYGKEPPVIEDAPPAPAAATPPAATDELDKALEGLPKEDADEIKAFALENKVTPELAKKWVDKTKAAIEKNKLTAANMEKQIEQEKTRQRRVWHDELKNDKDFGGANFDSNINRAEKVLQEFMPQTKKELTARKAMLPPYVMRDLAKMADHLYATDKLTTGDPIPPVKEETADDPLAYYNS